MTFIEKLLEEHPDKKSAKSGTLGCPSDYGYESRRDYETTSSGRWCRDTSCPDCWARKMPEGVVDGIEHSRILDSGERRQFETGAVRDIQEGKGRCDLMPLGVVYNLLKLTRRDAAMPIEYIRIFQESGDTTALYEAIKFFMEYNLAWESESSMLLEVAKHFEEGAKKYGENNWQKGLPVNCYIDSAVRHYLKWLRHDKDEPHDRAFVWNLMCYIWECDYSPRAKEKEGAPKEERKPGVFYICDQKRCGGKCPNPDCHHTDDIRHAKNFVDVGFGVYEEKCHACKLIPVTGDADLVRLGDYAGGIFEFADTAYVKVKLDYEQENNILCIDVLTGASHTYSPDILVQPLDTWNVDGDADE